MGFCRHIDINRVTFILKRHVKRWVQFVDTVICVTNTMDYTEPITSKVALTHWRRATHICDGKLITIGSDNGLSPGRRQAIIRTIAGILLIGPLGTNFSEILVGIQAFSFKIMHLKMSSAKWRRSCLGLNVLNDFPISERQLACCLKRPSLGRFAARRGGHKTIWQSSHIFW